MFKTLKFILLILLLTNMAFSVPKKAYAACQGPGASAKINTGTLKNSHALGENIIFELINVKNNYSKYKIQFECDCDPTLDGTYTEFTDSFVLPKNSPPDQHQFNPPFSINNNCNCFIALHDTDNAPTYCDSFAFTTIGAPSQFITHPVFQFNPSHASIDPSCESEFYDPAVDDRQGDGVDTVFGCIPIETKKLVVWLLKYLIPFAGGIGFIMLLAGAISLMTAAGDPEKIAKAQQLITSAIAGMMFIIFGIYILQIIGVEIIKIPGF